ncbi:MAG: hypothetical protein ACR2K6_02445 [Solirubrobacterales bacterium]
MAKRKTTVYIDEELLRMAKVRAARTDRRDSEILEAALRNYLGLSALEEMRARSDLNEEQAMELAYAELRELRRDE